MYMFALTLIEMFFSYALSSAIIWLSCKFYNEPYYTIIDITMLQLNKWHVSNSVINTCIEVLCCQVVFLRLKKAVSENVIKGSSVRVNSKESES